MSGPRSGLAVAAAEVGEGEGALAEGEGCLAGAVGGGTRGDVTALRNDCGRGVT